MKHVLVLLLFWSSGLVLGNDGDAILGHWTTEGGDKIEIYRGEDGTYCARILDLVEPDYPEEDPMAGTPKVDRENPDETLRDRPIIGLQIMEGFTAKAPGRWSGGTIYDPENGKTYKCKIRLTEEGALKVRGYIGVSAIGRTTVWTR